MPILQRDGFSTYYEDVGSGDPVVLVCGLSADLQIWRFQIHELRRTHRVIAFDNRGAGRSDAPDAPYTIRQMAGDLKALLDHLKIDSAHIAGWSMGGVIAQSLALAHPERVKQLVLLSSFVAPDGYFLQALSSWVNARRSNMPYEQVVRHMARLVFSHEVANEPNVYDVFIKAMLVNPYPQSAHGFFRQAEALASYRAPPELASLRIPAAVLVGEYDQFTPKYLSEQLARTLSAAAPQVLPGAHSGFLERPEEWTRALRNVLDRARTY